jgi:uroporphyrin-III C-methyltransferase / precorrin-2 dehydrogenase / sirohydrochlorin ferrochelatase
VATPLFPLFLKLENRRVVLVGAGTVAAEKLRHLLEAGADVTVVAPEIGPAIETAPVTIVRRGFEAADLDGAWFVVAAAPASINRVVAEAAAQRRIFVNAVDDPASASAYAAAVLRRDQLTIAISTDGVAPALAGLFREALDALLPRDLADWFATARRARAEWLKAQVPMRERRPLLLEALNRIYEGRRPQGGVPVSAAGLR